MLKKNRNTILTYAAAFIIPVAIILLVMIILGITPFGDTSVFFWDAKLQHKDYYGYLWDLLHGNASIDYSAGKSLGGRMLGLIGFYISSPLNILLYFFDKSDIPTFMALMIVLRIGLCGVTSQFFIRSRSQFSMLPALFFSTAYALMEYNVYYCRNVMWLDGVIMLPLIAAGIWKLISENKKVLLWISVAVAIIANWYTGYMVCLMSGLYFIYEYFTYTNFHPIKTFKKNWKIILRYVLTLLLGVISSLVVLLPACMALIGGKATHNSVGFSGIIHFDLLHFFSGFEINAAVNDQSAPVIFCSAIMLISVVYYFFSKNIRKKEKLTSAIFGGFLIASFCLQDLELLWTAFVQSTSYYFRFSFVVPFFMLVLSCRAWTAICTKGVEKKATAFSVTSILVIFYVLARSDELNTASETMALYALFIAVTGVFIVLYKSCRRVIRQGTMLCLCAMLIFELGYNSYKAFRDYYLSADEFSDYVDETEVLLAELNEKAGDTFYRFEKNESYLTIADSGNTIATCESLLFNYNSIEHYSSAYDEKVDEFLAKIGYSDLASESVFLCETYWNSPMVLTDSLLSVKYAVLSDDTFGYEKTEISSEIPFDGDIYENEGALPQGYNVSEDAYNLEYTDNPFENQSLLVSALTGESRELYLTPDTEFEGFDGNDEIYTITAVTDGPLYLYIDSGETHSNLYSRNCEVYVNGEKFQNCCTRFMMNTMLLGDYSAGDTVEVVIRHNTDDMDQHSVITAQLDTQQYAEVIEKLASGSESNLNIDGNIISGTYTTDTDSTVFLSIPYEESWTLYIDGEEADIQELAGAFIGFELTAGTHSIELVYHTSGLRMGAALSVAGTLIFIAYEIISKKRRKKVK